MGRGIGLGGGGQAGAAAPPRRGRSGVGGGTTASSGVAAVRIGADGIASGGDEVEWQSHRGGAHSGNDYEVTGDPRSSSFSFVLSPLFPPPSRSVGGPWQRHMNIGIQPINNSRNAILMRTPAGIIALSHYGSAICRRSTNLFLIGIT